MMASRSIKPKLSLSISTATASASPATRPALSLQSPRAASAHHGALRSPIPPSPMSPTAYNTSLNQRGFASKTQQPTYAYTNNSSSRSILKKQSSSSKGHHSAASSKSSASSASARRQLQFSDKPQVYCVTPIEDEDYYGPYAKMSKEERRWGSRR